MTPKYPGVYIEKIPSGIEPVGDARTRAISRRLMLDLLSAIMPDWRQRNPVDVSVALVELWAYIADILSYYQDAVAREGFLGSARRRVTVKLHAHLLDYFIPQRAEVAYTLRCRRRKGTAATLEPLARDLTPWNRRVVKYLELRGATQYRSRLRMQNLRTPELRKCAGAARHPARNAPSGLSRYHSSSIASATLSFVCTESETHLE